MAVVVALVLVLAAVLAGVVLTRSGDDVRRTDQRLPMPGATIDTSWFVPSEGGATRPTVLLAHGLGGTKDDARERAEKLVGQGYNVLTWSARGFGASTGRIGLNGPGSEVADVRRLISWVARRPGVELDRPGDPRVGVAGVSYGGAVSLLAAGHDQRVDAIAPEITYWDLSEALVPGGVFKKMWAGALLSTAGGCAALEKPLCAAYTRIAENGRASKPDLDLLRSRSPVAVADSIKVPTLLVQGRTDSLFPLGQADAAARAISRNGVPVAVDWVAGGHDGGDVKSDTERVEKRTLAWFDRYLKGDKGVDTGPAFRVSRDGGTDDEGSTRVRSASRGSYPGLSGTGSRTMPLAGGTKPVVNPPGGQPADVSSLPGAGLLGRATQLGVDVALDFPGQSASFVSAPLTEPLTITGSSRVRLRVSSPTGEAVLFVKLYDAGPKGTPELPSRLATPVHVSTPGGRPVEVDVRLPTIDHEVAVGHRLRLTVASTDQGYASPVKAATYRVAVVGDVTVPTVDGMDTSTDPIPFWVWLLPLLAAALAAWLLLSRPRQRRSDVDPELAGVPLRITGLTKRYPGTERPSVDDLSFEVGRGQVLGLLGPNGAGKTSALRMVMGLTMPDAGEIRVFGEEVTPGSPALARLGAFVEGPGFLPHLSGRDNLDLYWRATGRPAEESRTAEALEVAALSDEALARPVRTYSQGMRQRLAIAQAMLGRPDVLVLDEPTNGLDPGQIRQMRAVMAEYARGGRTVIVSSHLLAEVEQLCTHLVVMDRGRLVRAGATADIIGDDRLEDTFLRIVAEAEGASSA